MNGSIRTARHGALLLLVSAGACAHDEPFAPEDHNTRVPFADTEPARLTWSEFSDTGPVWLADGESFLYSFVRTDTPEGDRCLGVLPRTGGQRVGEICRRTLADRDSIDMLDMPAVSAGARLAYRRAVATPIDGTVWHQELVAATLDDPLTATVLTSIPFTGSDGAFYTSLSQPQWVGESALAFIGRVEEIVSPCPGCDPFLIQRNNGIVVVPADGSRTATLLPGTTEAASVAGSGDGAILYAREGDTRIYRRRLDTGEESVVFDAATAVPGELTASGDRIALTLPGGILVADLASGESTTVPAAGLAELALSPDGTVLIGEAINSATFDSDLWRVTLP
ncbi:MAG TPA: hypothetical protein VFT04_03770 [Gemmatimonadales bacterium]|nr:hypothetical protein [Gemmatimonadales bacterium]